MLPLTFPAGDHSEILECYGWRGNPVGEITYNYLITVWRPSTTVTEMRRHWYEAARLNDYDAGFNAVFDKTWVQFVCDFETYYGISRATATCAGDLRPPTRPEGCAAGDRPRGADDDSDSDGDRNVPASVIGAASGVAVAFCCVAACALGIRWRMHRKQAVLSESS